MSGQSSPVGKIIYGAFFLVVLPYLLVTWARLTEPFVSLPVPGTITTGILLSGVGGLIILIGMITLMAYGKGLPMNAYPPEEYVQKGIYRFFSHPIYIGFIVLCFGYALVAQSASGFWLVSPFILLGCVALIYGYEKHDLEERFGVLIRKPLISLPSNATGMRSVGDVISVYLLVFVPWFLLYEGVAALGIPVDAVNGYLPFENQIPVVEWTEVFYGGTYLFVLLVPFLPLSSQHLRSFALEGLIATGITISCFLLVPLIAIPREFVPTTFLGTLLSAERLNDTPAAAFPSFHVIWALLAAQSFTRALPRLRLLWWGFATLIAISCITTGMHSIIDLLGGILVYFIASRYDQVWEGLRSLTERIANSWKEWHIGPIRIINHGIYAGVGTFLGLLIIGVLLGAENMGYILIVAFTSLIMAGLWAQYVEGSPSLLRPYGYYGGVLGVVLGGILAHWFGGDLWLLLAAFSVTGPVIQAMGRLRCLVQGCCHGKETSPIVGIRYRHPRSRVCRLAHLENVPLHPTPLYSILWNIITGLLLARLWSLDVTPPIIAGLYLIFNGLGRFVEESYRGEPQTTMIGKLRLYQVIALLSILSGAILTTQTVSTRLPVAQFSWEATLTAFGFGLFTWFALGVDFPNSNKRFSRLASN